MNLDDEDFGLDKNSKLYKLLNMLREKEDAGDDDTQLEMEQLAELASDPEGLGKPHKIEEYEEGDLKITVKYWFVPGGEIKNVDIEGDDSLVSQEDLEDKIAQIIQENGDLSVVGVDINDEQQYELGTNSIISMKSMETSLELAVNNEDYQLAAKIRDDIKERDGLIEITKEDIIRNINEGKYEDAKILVDKVREIRETGYNYGY